VGEEDREVDRAKPGGIDEVGGFGVGVVVKVGNQEKRRGDERADHAVAVGDLALLFDLD